MYLPTFARWLNQQTLPFLNQKFSFLPGSRQAQMNRVKSRQNEHIDAGWRRVGTRPSRCAIPTPRCHFDWDRLSAITLAVNRFLFLAKDELELAALL
jgi:hypothetical protein